MPLQTFAVPGATPEPLLSRARPTQMGISPSSHLQLRFLSILKSLHHELRIAHGLTLMTPSPRGWEAFPTPGALTHTRITWAFSPSVPQVPGVTPGSPCARGVSGVPYGEVHNNGGFFFFLFSFFFPLWND